MKRRLQNILQKLCTYLSAGEPSGPERAPIEEVRANNDSFYILVRTTSATFVPFQVLSSRARA